MSCQWADMDLDTLCAKAKDMMASSLRSGVITWMPSGLPRTTITSLPSRLSSRSTDSSLLDYFEHELDLNANMLVQFDNGAHGTFSCSQVAAGHYNGFVIRIFGTLGCMEWEQEHPDFLKVTLKGQPTQIYTRAAHTSGHALDLNRIPSGHPEGLTMAFANIYKVFADAVQNRKSGLSNDGKWDLDFPSVDDGLHGVRFIEACVKSSRNGGIWVEV